MRPIRVHSKTLAHISSGLYRSTSGAIKELVSNSFDANATEVMITTNSPSFDVLSCSDNGTGITVRQFEQLMGGGIGYSQKRKSSAPAKFGRPVIGRIGIGLLSMTQLSHSFRVISHHGESQTSFRADVSIRDYLLADLDLETEYDLDAEIGQFEIEEIPYEADRTGVTIVSSEMKTGLIQRFQQSDRTELPMKFGTFLNQLQKEQSISRLGPYWDLIWGLSIYCPVKYVPEGPVSGRNVLKEIRGELEDYNFELIVDGMPIRKPIRFPRPEDRRLGLEYFTKTFDFDAEVEGRRLRFSGYLYAQDGKSLVPVEYRGILIRIRNVAIGGFDKTFLDYEIAEGPRFGWLCGEVYVSEGLEDALNVDRDSFNSSHPHFLKLREFLHLELQGVFRRLYKGIDKRSREKQETLVDVRRRHFAADLEELFDKSFNIVEVDDIPNERPVSVDLDNGQIAIANSFEWPRNLNKRQFAEQLLISWELAHSTGRKSDQTRLFAELSKRVLKNFKRW